MDGYWANIIKYLLFITNALVFMMAGIVAVFLLVNIVQGGDVQEVVTKGDAEANISLFSFWAIIALIVCLVIMGVTFLGCCGAFKENKTMLAAYFVVLLLLFVLLVVMAIVIYSSSSGTAAESKFNATLTKSLEAYKPDSEEESDKKLVRAWDHVQEEFMCCGVTTLEDWRGNEAFERSDDLPDSCCSNMANCTKDNSFEDGCYTKLKDLIEGQSKTILIVAIIAFVIIFLNMIFAFIMCTMVLE